MAGLQLLAVLRPLLDASPFPTTNPRTNSRPLVGDGARGEKELAKKEALCLNTPRPSCAWMLVASATAADAVLQKSPVKSKSALLTE